MKERVEAGSGCKAACYRGQSTETSIRKSGLRFKLGRLVNGSLISY